MLYLLSVFWSFTVDINKLLNVLRTFEEDDSISRYHHKQHHFNVSQINISDHPLNATHNENLTTTEDET